MDVLPFLGADHAVGTVLVKDGDRLMILLRGVAEQQVLKAPPGQLRSFRILVAQQIQERRHKVVSRKQAVRLYARADNAGEIEDARHLHGSIKQIEREGRIALAPYAMLAAAEAVIAGIDDQRVIADALFFQLGHDSAHAVVHALHSRIVAAEQIAQRQKLPALIRKGQAVGDVVRKLNAAGAALILGNVGEGAVVIIVIDIFLFVLIHMRAVRRSEGKVEIERLVLIRAFIDKAQRIVGNHVGHVALGLHLLRAAESAGIPIGSAAARRNKPVAIALLRLAGSAHMPFAADAAGIAVFRQDIRIAGNAFQIVDRRIVLFIAVAHAQPILNTVLAGNAPGQQRGARGRAHRRYAEEIIQLYAAGGQRVDIGRADFLIAGTPQRPVSLIVRQNHDDVRLFFHKIPLLFSL